MAVLGAAHGRRVLHALVCAAVLITLTSPSQAATGDRDGDGIADRVDRCPDDAGVPPHGCPPQDRDGDQVTDDKDRCPDHPGPIANRGCPDQDSDGDGLADRVDRCPTRYGLAAHAGCPPADSDGDGVPDATDRCPTTAEVWNGVRDNDGCPDKPAALVIREPTRVRFTQRITFNLAGNALSQASQFYLRIAARLLRNQTPGQVDVVVVADYGQSYGESIQRARRHAAVIVDALRKLVPAYIKLRAAGRGPDGRRRVELVF